jgi:transcriptional regulator with XRE-family HTH domain
MDIGAFIASLRLAGDLSQRELAQRAGTSQPAIARLEQGRASPTLATLQRLARAAGFELRLELVPRPLGDPVVDAYKRDIDRTLLRENLKKTADQRIRSLAKQQDFMREVRRATKKAKRKQ